VTTAFSYADKLFTPVTTTLIYSIGAVIFPKWSESYAKMELEEYRSYVGKVVENTVVLLLPLSVLFSVFGEPIIRVLFEGGSFTAESSQLTGGIFTCYMLGMIGFALLDLLSKAFYATGKTKDPLLVNIGVVGLNFVLNVVLLKVTSSPAVIAGSTAAVLTLGGAVLAALFFRGGSEKIFSFKKILLSLGISLGIYLLLWLGTGFLVSPADSKGMLILKCGAMGALALLLYFGLMSKELQLKTLLKREKN
ncbi:MAG: oligosaccharide flippase family protein, partial [Clostridia bacterium]|nr:oligosaccharide flippase family protein [Clostridia bacterium]